MTEHLKANQIDRAAELLADSGLVAFPTETVYGLGANALDGQAVARIFEAKGRPSFNPLIVHVASLEDAEKIGEFNDAAHDLAQAFWPGPISLVVPVRNDAGISELVTAGLPSVAVRVPEAALAQQLLRKVGVPIAAPSANPSGQISPTTAEHVLSRLDGRIEAVLDGGPCPVGLESTIVGTEPLTLLRPGGVPLEALEACLGRPLPSADAAEGIIAPGQLRSHYAPDAALRLNAERCGDDEFLIGFGHVDAAINLSPAGDLTEAAANLFAMLRQADEMAEKIAVSPIPEHGLGLAINDRLRRAAAPRD